tara:strand:- start:104 stop:499 length:396 start_codon:yes stop_codon:yes gene_type:complete
MIQRVQSLYLLLAIFLITLATFNLSFYDLNDQVYTAKDDLKMLFLLVSVNILCLIALFAFKNRKLQMKLIRFAIVSELIVIIRSLMLWILFQAQIYLMFIIFMFFIFIFLIMAYRGVRKDEDLVRSVDRIR